MCSYGNAVGRLIVIQRSKWLCKRPPSSPWMKTIPSVRGTAAVIPGTVQVGAVGRCSAVSLLLFVSTWNSCFEVQVGAQLSPKAQGIPMAPLGWLLKHSSRCPPLRWKPLEHLEHLSRPSKKHQSAAPERLGGGSAKSPKGFSNGKRKCPWH